MPISTIDSKGLTSPLTSGVTTNTVTSATSTALTLQSAGTTAITVDTSQNVGVGLTSPSQKLDVSGSAQLTYAGGNNYLYFQSTNNYVGRSGSTGDVWLNTVGGQNTIFGISAAEKMRLDANGNLRIGQTTGNADARTSINGGSTDSSPCIDYVKNSSTTTTAQVYARFTAGSTGTGSITANGAAAAAFTAWSDRRLKENIIDLPSQLANIMALRPVEFDYVESMGGGHQIGFIAQDVQTIYPDLVGEDVGGMFTLTDLNKNDARLIKAIQELKQIVDTQAAEIAELKAKVA
jgi:hypothetical protein